MHHCSSLRQLLTLLMGALLLSGCSPKEHDQVIATVGSSPIMLSEYESQYLKNAPNRDSAAAMPMSERQRFLDLMVNYKLKLNEATQKQLDKQAEVKAEVDQYKGGLASSFVADREIIGPGLRELYARKSEEIRASHILIPFPAKTTTEDSLVIFKKANAIADSIRKGAKMDSLARIFSLDPTAKENGGDLYYASAGSFVAPFEDAIFSMQPGQVSVARTSYGVHVIKVFERHPSPGERRVSHIMIRLPQNPKPADTVEAYAKIKAISDSLAKGISFDDLAMRNSTDPGSSSKGGDLGWFSRRRWPIPFDEACFTLKLGDVSGIVRTRYGYHLIKCTGVRPPKSFDESKQELQQQFQQSRYPTEYAEHMSTLKKNFGYVRHDDVIKDYLALCDSNKTTHDSIWAASASPALLKRTVFSSNRTSMTLDTLLGIIRQRTDLAAAPLRYQTFMTPVGKVEEQYLWALAADSLAKIHPEFASLMEEYREGVLLYQLEQEHVWNKIAPTDSILQDVHSKNKERYAWPDRVDFTDVKCPAAKGAATVSTMLQSGKSLDAILALDSVRMAQPTQFEGLFKPKSLKPTKELTAALKAALTQAASDSSVDIQVRVYADTGKGEAQTAATQKADALKKLLVNAGFDSTRITLRKISIKSVPEAAGSDSVWRRYLALGQVSIMGRQPWIQGKPEVLLLPTTNDDRSLHADSLTPGQFSKPFQWHGVYYIVRLDKREPARLKTYEEAKNEVSSFYQESESKRLEDDWVKQLRASTPVTQDTEVLRAAFAPKK